MIPAVLRLRDFRRVFWAQVISTVGDFFVPALNEILSGLSIGVDGTLWETTLQRNVPPEAPSRVSAYDGRDSTALRPLG
jgi:hypothetical protein